MKASTAGQKHKLNIKYTIRISKNIIKIKIETICTICYLNEMRELYSCAGMCKSICYGLQKAHSKFGEYCNVQYTVHRCALM